MLSNNEFQSMAPAATASIIGGAAQHLGGQGTYNPQTQNAAARHWLINQGIRSMKIMRMWVLLIAALALLFNQVAKAEDPCVNLKRRALVMSGGGAKGAFEAGAVYHLVVQRHCDFDEFSGSSVGALNSAFLGQAAKSIDTDESLANLSAQSEELVSLWQSIKSSKDIRKPRRFATLRFGLFGLDSMNDMEPLRHLLDRNISMERLANGRHVRAAVVSFWSGVYREVVAQPSSTRTAGGTFLEYLYASSVLPVYAKMPRIADGSPFDDPKMWSQFSDGGLRHITPLASYFKICKKVKDTEGQNLPQAVACFEDVSRTMPPHEPVEQLFVIVTSPYSRDSDELPIMDVKCCRNGSHQIKDGRKILSRTLALMDDAVYRSDLEFSLTANDMLRWRWQAYNRLVLNESAEELADSRQRFLAQGTSVVESYNRDTQDRDAPSRPYEIGLIVPKKEFADASHLLVVSPSVIQAQLYCGCIAADEMMARDFDLPSLSNQCAQRFPRLIKSEHNAHVAADWDPAVCGSAYSDKQNTLEIANDLQNPAQ